MTAPYLQPFVLSVDSVARERHGRVDLYVQEGDGRYPAVVFVHGGPVPADLVPTPRDWPLFVGYGNAVAARGAVGVTVDHRLHDFGDFATAAEDVVAAVELARKDARVDPRRIALWFFSGAGFLVADWLREAPEWVRCVGLNYPAVAAFPGVEIDARFRPVEAVGTGRRVPIVLTRVGREREMIAEGVAAFVGAAGERGADLRIIDVPEGQHGFDQLDHTEQSREAVERALRAVLDELR
ncbi:alpha/beta hydrolase [Nocardia terpenica]|uniref:alpha/beta hydrolase n=1 Tax=Nocardia terpenica TaxID=455432 RepID=UPI0015C5235D|nr:hypothetical protein [Nocardia terpenica]NQE88472.1 hypothetical protein [Nocardia terpenica]